MLETLESHLRPGCAVENEQLLESRNTYEHLLSSGKSACYVESVQPFHTISSFFSLPLHRGANSCQVTAVL